MQTVDVDVCIVGGGPAGMMLGLLLSKQGYQTLVLESHATFERAFRGEVLQPRFARMMSQLGLLERLLVEPHIKLSCGEMYFQQYHFGSFNYKELDSAFPYALWMPQPILLNAMHEWAKTYPNFKLCFHSAMTDLLYNNTQVSGVTTTHNGEIIHVRAKLTVGADGRFSRVREAAGIDLAYDVHHHDVVWFETEKPTHWVDSFRFILSPQHTYMLLPKYPNTIQGGITIPKGGFVALRKKGIDDLRQQMQNTSPLLAHFADSITDFTPFTVLQARTFYAREWARDGLLLIGDAAHCASPAGAIGVSMAVGTAIVAADVIDEALRRDDVSAQTLSALQSRRRSEVKRIHQLQLRGEQVILSLHPWLKRGIPTMYKLLNKTSIVNRLQRQLVVQQPLPIHHPLYFS